MASPSMQSLATQIQQNYLTCVICQGNFTHPKALPCLHTFCSSCLRDYIYSRAFDTVGKFPCPVCRKDIEIPAQGISGFPDNHILNSLKDTVRKSPQKQISPRKQTPGGASIRLYPDLSGFSPSPSSPLSTLGSPSSPYNVLTMDTPPSSVSRRFNGAIMCFGKYGSDLSDLHRPTSIGVVPQGYLIIADQEDNKVLVFDHTGNINSVFICKGDLESGTVTKNGTILLSVTNAGHALALEYDLKGHHIGTYGHFFMHHNPFGVASDSEGRVIVTMPESHCVCVLSKEGKMVHTFGTRGRGPQHFLKPYYVTTNSVDDIIVSDYENNCIQVFTKHGKFKYVIGKAGSKPGQLNKPLGVCVDRADNIIVADSGNQRVQVFTPGRKQADIVVQDQNLRAVKPEAVAINDNGGILVVLYTGPQFSEVRVYRYNSKSSKKGHCLSAK